MQFKKFNGSTWETVRHKRYGSGTDSLTAFPAQIQASGEPLTDYTILGNTVQNGTPTPSVPIEVQGCGDKTLNVMPSGEKRTATLNGVTCTCDGLGTYTLKGTSTNLAQFVFGIQEFTIPVSVGRGGNGTFSMFNNFESNMVSVAFYHGTTQIDAWSFLPLNRTNNNYASMGGAKINKLIINIPTGVVVDGQFSLMFTDDGQFPSTFEPYGYKLTPTVNGTEHPIYLGQVETTRRIRKYEFTGEENGTIYSTGTSRKGIEITGISGVIGGTADVAILAICTHYNPDRRINLYRNTDNGISNAYQNDNVIFYDASCQTVEAFRQFCAQQYAAGTPVTIWYVLVEPETAVVNDPLHKIGIYEDTITMAQAGVTIPTSDGDNTITFGTTVKPSAMSATFKGWHPVQASKQYDGSEWR